MTLHKQTLLTLGLLALLFTSCSTGNNEEAVSVDNSNDTTGQIASLADITDHLASKTQIFIIDPSKDTLIKCQKGTMIYLPAKALQFQNGSVPTESVQMEIKECYTLADLIGDNLSTTSGEEILETGGMVHISVSSNGQALTMKDGKAYALYFPRNGNEQDMQLFYGNHDASGQVDWTLDPASETEASESIMDERGNLDKSLYTCKMIISGYTLSINGYTVEWKMKNSKESLHDYFLNNFPTTDSMKAAFCSRAYKSEFSLKLDVTGKVSDVIFESTTTPAYDEIIANFFYALPPLDINTMAKHAPNVQYGLVISGITELDEDRYKKEFEEKYASFKDIAVSKIDKAELHYYVQTATKFAWINCDRFWNTPEEKVDYAVKTTFPNDARVLITFKDINSVMQGTMQGDRFLFSNVPLNQHIKVIAISYDKGTPIMGTAETRTDIDGFELTAFNEFSLAQLEAALNE